MSPHEHVNQRRSGLRVAGLALLCLTLISGCTAQFLYNRLNFLIPWYLSGQVAIMRPVKLLRVAPAIMRLSMSSMPRPSVGCDLGRIA